MDIVASDENSSQYLDRPSDLDLGTNSIDIHCSYFDMDNVEAAAFGAEFPIEQPTM